MWAVRLNIENNRWIGQATADSGQTINHSSIQ